MIDPEKARERLLPQGNWRPWQTPRPPLEIDRWVAEHKQKFKRLPPHVEHDGCPFAYVRRGLVTAVYMADRQARRWIERNEDFIRNEPEPKHIEATLVKYAAEATAIAETATLLHQRLSGFLQLHQAVDGNLYRFCHPTVAATALKPEIDQAAVLDILHRLVALPGTLKLDEIKKAAAEARQVWVNNQGDIWKKTFVAHLGLIWRDLMGKPPKNSDPFKEFVAEAWAAVGGGKKEKFDWTVREVVPGFKA